MKRTDALFLYNYITEVIRMYLLLYNNSACNSHYNAVAVLGFENWVGRVRPKNTYAYSFIFGKVED